MAQNATLSFLETYTVDRFKSIHSINKLDVIKNPHTGKLFFNCPDDSTISGKVSDGWQADPAISKCTDTQSGDVFFMLHKRGTGGQNNIVASL